MARSGPEKPVVPLERERELTIGLLSDHFANDNLTLDELERRIELAYRASSVPALRELTKDLRREPDADVPQSEATVPEVFAPDRDRVVSIMTQTKRRGMWQPAKHLDLWCVMSETHLDLTRARLSPGVTEIHLRALMASVKLIVPPGVRVVVQPSAFMAEVSDEVLDPPPVGSNAPVVRITGGLVMSELKVRVRTRELESGQEP
jgi:cell wall-active antibiotic response 4TMS protein YvqF/uncharacterized protein DUF1707